MNHHQAHQSITFQDQLLRLLEKKTSFPCLPDTFSCFLITYKEPIFAFPSAFSIVSHNLSLEKGLFLRTVMRFYYLTTSQLCLIYHCSSFSSLTSVPLMKKQNKGFTVLLCASSICCCPYSKDSCF